MLSDIQKSMRNNPEINAKADLKPGVLQVQRPNDRSIPMSHAPCDGRWG